MIVYDGVSLDSVANVKIEDIRVSPIQYDEITRPRAIRGGSVFIRSRAGTRTIAITFALLDDNKVNRQAALMAVSGWAKNDREYRLELPGHPEYYLMAICTGKPEPSLRQWWEGKLRLVFTCYENPFWNAKAEKSAAVGTEFTVMGNAPPLMRIERTWAASAYGIGYSLDNNTINLYRVTAGKMVIDLNQQTIEIAGQSAMENYLMTSNFIIPRTGKQTITGIGSVSNFGTVKWRERWQ